jgi:hypothetical protein
MGEVPAEKIKQRAEEYESKYSKKWGGFNEEVRFSRKREAYIHVSEG